MLQLIMYAQNIDGYIYLSIFLSTIQLYQMILTYSVTMHFLFQIYINNYLYIQSSLPNVIIFITKQNLANSTIE